VRGKVNPKTQVQKTEPGAPSALRWFVMGGKFASPIDTRFWMTSLSSGAPGYGSIPLEKGEVRYQGSATARKFKNRTLKTEGCGTQKRLGAYVCATRPKGKVRH
jgi:hypothetical protein